MSAHYIQFLCCQNAIPDIALSVLQQQNLAFQCDSRLRALHAAKEEIDAIAPPLDQGTKQAIAAGVNEGQEVAKKTQPTHQTSTDLEVSDFV